MDDLGRLLQVQDLLAHGALRDLVDSLFELAVKEVAFLFWPLSFLCIDHLSELSTLREHSLQDPFDLLAVHIRSNLCVGALAKHGDLHEINAGACAELICEEGHVQEFLSLLIGHAIE